MPAPAHVPSEGPLLRFETGRISEESMELILNTLPVDMTFIDETDTVRLFSNNADRIFTRPKTIIGRKVQNCHPPASVHVVERLLDSFRSGEKDVEEFWLEFQGIAHIHPVHGGSRQKRRLPRNTRGHTGRHTHQASCRREAVANRMRLPSGETSYS